MNANTTPPDPDDARLDEWLDRHLNDLTDAVDDAIDIEAGLQDTRLPDRAQDLNTSLDNALDVDTGLHAIVAQSNVPPVHESTPIDNDATATPTPLEQFAKDLARRPLSERLAMRSHLPWEELHLVQLLAMARNTMVHLLEHPGDRARTHDRIRALIRALIRSHSLALPRALARDLDIALERAHELDRLLPFAPDGARGLVRNLARDLDIALERALDRVIPFALEVARARARDIAGDIAYVLALPYRTTHRFRELAAGVEALEAVVTDFTTADLADLDLRGVDLRGVRWSLLTTRWPPGWDEPIREASVQLDPDQRPDLYEVRDDPRVRHTVR